jgi:cytidylate kinase
MGIPKQGPVVAIDGPAGTGKSSATKRLAEALKFVHVDTGALYRAVAYLTLTKEDSKEREEGLASDSLDSTKETGIAIEIARTVNLQFKRMPRKVPSNRIFANSRDLTDFIRTPEVSITSSRISAIPEVRAALLGLQRRLGCQGKAILEGRDIGTVIFPDADVKFFLTASVDERAKRRLIELEATGSDALSYEEVKRQIVERDHGDSTRKVAPLRKAQDALQIDTTSMTLDEVVKEMELIVRRKLSEA